LLGQCKEGAIIINTSRGPIVNTGDLVDHLESGHLTGACLDVLENEKLDTLNTEQKLIYQKLFDLDSVILSPHVAGWTKESLIKIADYLLMKIGRFYSL
jgi:D-3-phosphoglycerate dehydrogenase